MTVKTFNIDFKGVQYTVTIADNNADNYYSRAVEKYKEKMKAEYINLARDIIAGKYGNGDERKKKIIELGYDYDFVQIIVGIMLGGD